MNGVQADEQLNDLNREKASKEFKGYFIM